jgi:hypothetical protein
MRIIGGGEYLCYSEYMNNNHHAPIPSRAPINKHNMNI